MKKLLVRLVVISMMLAGSMATHADDSLYQLHLTITSQSGQSIPLDVERGHPTIISMFYASCPAACPLLISSIQAYEQSLDPESRSRLRVLMVSFDPRRDKPAVLAQLAHSHRADPQRWTFSAAASDVDARKLAALLGIQYRQTADGDFDHTLRITLLDASGRVVAHTSQLFKDEAFRAQLRQATATP